MKQLFLSIILIFSSSTLFAEEEIYGAFGGWPTTWSKSTRLTHPKNSQVMLNINGEEKTVAAVYNELKKNLACDGFLCGNLMCVPYTRSSQTKACTDYAVKNEKEWLALLQNEDKKELKLRETLGAIIAKTGAYNEDFYNSLNDPESIISKTYEGQDHKIDEIKELYLKNKEFYDVITSGSTNLEAAELADLINDFAKTGTAILNACQEHDSIDNYDINSIGEASYQGAFEACTSFSDHEEDNKAKAKTLFNALNFIASRKAKNEDGTVKDLTCIKHIGSELMNEGVFECKANVNFNNEKQTSILNSNSIAIQFNTKGINETTLKLPEDKSSNLSEMSTEIYSLNKELFSKCGFKEVERIKEEEPESDPPKEKPPTKEEEPDKETPKEEKPEEPPKSERITLNNDDVEDGHVLAKNEIAYNVDGNGKKRLVSAGSTFDKSEGRWIIPGPPVPSKEISGKEIIKNLELKEDSTGQEIFNAFNHQLAKGDESQLSQKTLVLSNSESSSLNKKDYGIEDKNQSEIKVPVGEGKSIVYKVEKDSNGVVKFTYVKMLDENKETPKENTPDPKKAKAYTIDPNAINYPKPKEIPYEMKESSFTIPKELPSDIKFDYSVPKVKSNSGGIKIYSSDELNRTQENFDNEVARVKKLVAFKKSRVEELKKSDPIVVGTAEIFRQLPDDYKVGVNSEEKKLLAVKKYLQKNNRSENYIEKVGTEFNENRIKDYEEEISFLEKELEEAKKIDRSELVDNRNYSRPQYFDGSGISSNHQIILNGKNTSIGNVRKQNETFYFSEADKKSGVVSYFSTVNGKEVLVKAKASVAESLIKKEKEKDEEDAKYIELGKKALSYKENQDYWKVTRDKASVKQLIAAGKKYEKDLKKWEEEEEKKRKKEESKMEEEAAKKVAPEKSEEVAKAKESQEKLYYKLREVINSSRPVVKPGLVWGYTAEASKNSKFSQLSNILAGSKIPKKYQDNLKDLIKPFPLDGDKFSIATIEARLTKIRTAEKRLESQLENLKKMNNSKTINDDTKRNNLIEVAHIDGILTILYSYRSDLNGVIGSVENKKYENFYND